MATNQPTVRAIIINPITKTVIESQVTTDFNALKRDVLNCDLAQVLNIGGGVDAWIDEEGLFKDWDEVGFTTFNGATQPWAGVIVLMGRANGGMANLPAFVTVDDVVGRITFTKPEAVVIPPTTLTTFEDDGTAVTRDITAPMTYRKESK